MYVYTFSIYVFNLRSKVTFNKWSKEAIFIKNHCDVQKDMARSLAYTSIK